MRWKAARPLKQKSRDGKSVVSGEPNIALKAYGTQQFFPTGKTTFQPLYFSCNVGLTLIVLFVQSEQKVIPAWT